MIAGKILIIDDRQSIEHFFPYLFSDPKYCIETAASAAEGLDKFREDIFDLTMLEIHLPDASGLAVLQKIKEIDPKAVVLVTAASSSTETAIEAIKSGAHDYLLKPFDTVKMKDIISEAAACGRLMRKDVILASENDQKLASDRMIGSSPVMQEVYKLIGRVAGSDVNVLLLGESGTGKELVARAIYQHSQRQDKPFLAVNCAAIPETLLESELFGYEKGAFTGATRRKIGKFDQANGGTIFLDEIGDMSLTTQAKVLGVLQDSCFERLGGEQTIAVDVRIIAATNKNLQLAISVPDTLF